MSKSLRLTMSDEQHIALIVKLREQFRKEDQRRLAWVEQLKESFRRAKRRYELVHGEQTLEIARIGLKGSIE